MSRQARKAAPATKLRQGYVFTPVCHSVHGGDAGGTSVKIPRNNVKLTRTIIMTITAYILFFMPIVAVTSIGAIFGTFTVGYSWGILEDIALLCQCMLGYTHHRADTHLVRHTPPPLVRHPPGQTPPRQTTLPPVRHAGIRSARGRYASY